MMNKNSVYLGINQRYGPNRNRGGAKRIETVNYAPMRLHSKNLTFTAV